MLSRFDLHTVLNRNPKDSINYVVITFLSVDGLNVAFHVAVQLDSDHSDHQDRLRLDWSVTCCRLSYPLFPVPCPLSPSFFILLLFLIQFPSIPFYFTPLTLCVMQPRAGMRSDGQKRQLEN